MEVRPGCKHTAVGFIPENWDAKPMAELFTFQNGVNAGRSAYGSGVPFINVLEVITHSTITAIRIPGKITLTAHAINAFAVQHGDVLFNRTSETQEEVGLAAVYVGTETVVFGGFVIRARPRDGRMNTRFTAYALRSQIVRSQIVARGQGAVRANIGQRDLSRVWIILPNKAEQEAIAEALGDVDALIESLELLLLKKRQLKQGAMEELLNGKKRLPRFEAKPGHKQSEMGMIPKDWDVRRLDEGITLTSGQHILARHCNAQGEGVAYITGPSDFPNGRIQHDKYTTKPETMCGKNDILVTVKGSGAGAVILSDATYCISRQLMAVRVLTWNTQFVFFSLLRNSSMFVAAAAGLIPGLSRSDILNQKLPLPPTKAEQDAIAAILSDMDTEIAALEAKLAKARQIKQGMMQELLTGRIRLV